MGDTRDWREIAYGPAGLGDTDSWARHFAETGPIRGPFDAKSPVPSAATFRERIHFIGFVNEKCYCPGEFRWREAAYYLPNPHLFSSNEKAAEAFRSYPLQLID